jgi:hypothetical protein
MFIQQIFSTNNFSNYDKQIFQTVTKIKFKSWAGSARVVKSLLMSSCRVKKTVDKKFGTRSMTYLLSKQYHQKKSSSQLLFRINPFTNKPCVCVTNTSANLIFHSLS